METLLTILIAYILGVAAYTVAVRRSPTNLRIKDVEIWPIVWDGAKGMAIGFAVVAALLFIVSQVITWIRV